MSVLSGARALALRAGHGHRADEASAQVTAKKKGPMGFMLLIAVIFLIALPQWRRPA